MSHQDSSRSPRSIGPPVSACFHLRRIPREPPAQGKYPRDSDLFEKKGVASESQRRLGGAFRIGNHHKNQAEFYHTTLHSTLHNRLTLLHNTQVNFPDFLDSCGTETKKLNDTCFYRHYILSSYATLSPTLGVPDRSRRGAQGVKRENAGGLAGASRLSGAASLVLGTH